MSSTQFSCGLFFQINYSETVDRFIIRECQNYNTFGFGTIIHWPNSNINNITIKYDIVSIKTMKNLYCYALKIFRVSFVLLSFIPLFFFLWILFPYTVIYNKLIKSIPITMSCSMCMLICFCLFESDVLWHLLSDWLKPCHMTGNTLTFYYFEETFCYLHKKSYLYPCLRRDSRNEMFLRNHCDDHKHSLN